MCLNPQIISWINAVDKPDFQYDEECVNKIMNSEDFKYFGFAEGEYQGQVAIFMLGLNEDLRPLLSENHWAASPLNQQDLTFEKFYSLDELLS